jgi:hypothetical protein
MAPHDRKREHLAAILRDLLKVTKVVSLYPVENPLPQMLKRSFAERLIELTEDYGDLAFTIERDRILYEAEVIFTDKSKEEALAGLFFSSGLTRITFTSGIKFEEIQKFLSQIKVYLNRSEQSGDLASLLWEGQFIGISFEIVEDLSLGAFDGDLNAHAAKFGVRINGHLAASDDQLFSKLFGVRELNDSGRTSNSDSNPLHRDGGDLQGCVGFGLAEASARRGEKTGESTDPNLPEYVTIEEGSLIDFPSDLVAGEDEVDTSEVRAAFKAMGLDQMPATVNRPAPNMKLMLNSEWQVSDEDEERIRTILSSDAVFNQYESTVELVKEMLLQESQMQDFYEVVDIADKVLGELISAGQFSDAANLLRYLYDLEAHIRPQRPLWAEKLKECCGKQAGLDRLRAVADATNKNENIPASELRRYLDLACSQKFMFLIELVGSLHHHQHAQSISDLLVLRGRENIHIVAKGLRNDNIETVCESISILGRIGDASMLAQMEPIKQHPQSRVRREIIRWIATAHDVRVLSILAEYIFDSDQAICQAALSALLDRSESIIGTLELLLSDPRFESLPPKVHQDILNVYAQRGGELAVQYLQELALRGGLITDAKTERQREAAFEALAYSATDQAERLLLKLTQSWRPRLRDLATHTIHRRREVLYGRE